MRTILAALLILTSPFLFAEDEEIPDPGNYLGYDLPAVFETCGVPTEVLSVRGDEPWQDDVVFRYGSDYALFFFRERVWQVRVWETGSLGGVSIGDTSNHVMEVLGNPAGEKEGSFIFNLPERGFPVRLRVCMTGDSVSDLYLYRADF